MRGADHLLAVVAELLLLWRLNHDILEVQVDGEGREADLKDLAEEEKGDVEPEVGEEPDLVPTLDVEYEETGVHNLEEQAH